jgi:CheY-like chemotaxis protein
VKTDALAHVLVVDDDEPIRDTLRSVLEDAGHTVTEAPDGVAALDILRTSPHRMVVLLDLRMPGLDGVGLLGTVAGDRSLASQHAYILMTANLQTLTLSVTNLLTTLSVPVLGKPFDLDVVLDTVEQAAARLTDA